MPGAFTVDQKTGFIEANYLQAFDAVKKTQILSYLAKAPFKIKEACEFIGVEESTFYRHIQQDPAFAKAVQELKSRRVEAIEQKLADRALVDEGVADRIFFLKCHKPALYNPTTKTEQSLAVTIEIKGLDQLEARESSLASNAIEAAACWHPVGNAAPAPSDGRSMLDTTQGAGESGSGAEA
jgi:hypothetical protein